MSEEFEEQTERALKAIQWMDDNLTLEEKAEFLGKMYQEGHEAYERT